ncbi:MAG: F0F1 ATP synthase subunit A [Candidatus Omnitrophica bacterium]|nr:F0F1 ATP synthase subunit A [Candidatus Omnitrophota bacterium]
MAEAHLIKLELPDFITILAEKFPGNIYLHYLYLWAPVIYSLIIILILVSCVYFSTRRISLAPNRMQNILEILAGGIDDFIRGIIGASGRKYTPFIGTLFIYILFMNLFGLIPFFKSSTASWSTTLALAICVFVYVQYVGIKEMGFLGYLDHLLGKPRGFLAFSLFIPLMMLILHIVSEFVRPISLSLRLRSNIWGDDMLLALVSGFGIKGVPLLIFSMLLAILASLVQAVVFSLLTTIYFALVLEHEE